MERRALVIERFIDANILLKPFTLLCGARNSIYLGALLLANLADDGTCRPRRPRNDKLFTGLHLAHLEQTL